MNIITPTLPQSIPLRNQTLHSDTSTSTILSSTANHEIPRWWTPITACEEFLEFKQNWEDLAHSKEAREAEAKKLRASCAPYNDDAHAKSTYRAPLGNVYSVPGNFGLWMSGVAIVAAYLTQKKQIKGLYVCDTLETLSAQLIQICSDPTNRRCAYVVGTFQSGCQVWYPKGFNKNFPQHKVTVCVEKQDGKLTIALLDAEPSHPRNSDILPQNLSTDLWEGYEKRYQFNCQELVFRAILNACRNAKTHARLLHSKVIREKFYGCEVFALQDALSYLRDSDFFNKIDCTKVEPVKIDEQYQIEAISMLPAEFMIGTQSLELLEQYKEDGGRFSQILVGKQKALRDYLDANAVEVTDDDDEIKLQNHYATKKSFQYLNFAVLALKHLSTSQIDEIVSTILLKQAQI